jgi:uncharacterized protein YdeI (YjbR/CyaY-like superfamily)
VGRGSDARSRFPASATLAQMGRARRGPDGRPIELFRDRTSWEGWLDENHAASQGVWLRLAKKSSKSTSVSYAEAVEVALCYGWIDGQSKGEDEDYSLQKFTPRAKRSRWSKINRERALDLIQAGRMRPPGLEEIERAQQDGRWDAAYDSPRTMKVPPDLQVALEDDPQAKAAFESLDSRNRYAILFRLQTAKKPETRARRIKQFIGMLTREESPHH